MNKHMDMLNDNIKNVLIALALPIIASNFVQTAFGLIDMIWVGRLGADAISAVGTASFYINLAGGVSTIIVIGTGVRVAQSLGAQKIEDARTYTKNSLVMALVLSVIFSVGFFIFAEPLIGYFNMENVFVETYAIQYLKHALFGVPLFFFATLMTAILTSYGNTKITFKANSIGLILNIILDPIMIFGLFGVPAMGIVGAAWATTISRLLTVFILLRHSQEEIKSSLSSLIDFDKIKAVIRLSAPATAQSLIFTFISMVIAKLVIQFGTDAIATQKIGIQIESITWMTIGGLQGAISAFVGQNFGAHKYDRIEDGFNLSLKIVTIFTLIITVIFLVFPKPIFSIFVKDPDVIDMGVGYMVAIAFSQVFMAYEMLSVGAFNGLDKTYAPPLVSITFTALRIPMAMILSKYMGLSGIWWSISISSIFKGTILVGWYKYVLKHELKN